MHTCSAPFHRTACLALSGEQLRRGANLAEGVDAVPPYFDSFAEYKEFCVQYRSKLSQIVRATAGWLPEQARALVCGTAARRDSASTLPSPCACLRNVAVTGHTTHSV